MTPEIWVVTKKLQHLAWIPELIQSASHAVKRFSHLTYQEVLEPPALFPRSLLEDPAKTDQVTLWRGKFWGTFLMFLRGSCCRMWTFWTYELSSWSRLSLQQGRGRLDSECYQCSTFPSAHSLVVVPQPHCKGKQAFYFARPSAAQTNLLSTQIMTYPLDEVYADGINHHPCSSTVGQSLLC